MAKPCWYSFVAVDQVLLLQSLREIYIDCINQYTETWEVILVHNEERKWRG